ncbi:MAG: hypothetical protein HGJ93_08315 [Desulfosarcina sp.]|nr:hypothetical protein [Desulfosarcina sp.]MBC2765947.1 hypothetical protein [Desulfosarcina sp.]
MDIQWLLQMPQQVTELGKGLLAPLALRAGDLLAASVLNVEKGNDALLSFGQFKAYARLPLPVVTGQDIQIRVEAGGERLRMVMVPTGGQAANVPTGERLEIRLFEPVSDKPFLSAHSRSLVSGESLQGRITGFEKDGLTLVDFGKFKAFAKIDIPVRQGQTIPLTVVKTDNGIAFEVAPRARHSGSTSVPPPIAGNVAPQDQAGVSPHGCRHGGTAGADSAGARSDDSAGEDRFFAPAHPDERSPDQSAAGPESGIADRGHDHAGGQGQRFCRKFRTLF